MRFTKMQGLGNDYLYFYGEAPENVRALAKKLSDRRFGAGSDGLIYVFPSGKADFAMRIFNADGSEAEMCGNGIRCVGKYLFDKGFTRKTELTVETRAGIRRLSLHVSEGAVSSVSVEMGKVAVGEEVSLRVCGRDFRLTKASVGNPHAVCFFESIKDRELSLYGRAIETSDAFPGGVNVEFVKALSRTELTMRVWERGSGITFACGTGACAAAAVCVKKGLCEASTPLSVCLDGGKLTVTVLPDFTAVMEGPAEIVYEGEIEP